MLVCRDRRDVHGPRRRAHVEVLCFWSIAEAIVAVVCLRLWTLLHGHCLPSARVRHWQHLRHWLTLSGQVTQSWRRRAVAWTLEASRVDVWWPIVGHGRDVARVKAWSMARLMPCALQACCRAMAWKLPRRRRRCHGVRPTVSCSLVEGGCRHLQSRFASVDRR